MLSFAMSRCAEDGCDAFSEWTESGNPAAAFDWQVEHHHDTGHELMHIYQTTRATMRIRVPKQ